MYKEKRQEAYERYFKARLGDKYGEGTVLEIFMRLEQISHDLHDDAHAEWPLLGGEVYRKDEPSKYFWKAMVKCGEIEDQMIALSKQHKSLNLFKNGFKYRDAMGFMNG